MDDVDPMDDERDGDDELPRGIALAWGVAANPSRGPKRELSIERIVETAIELADDGGLAAVSMSSVAARLGFTPMSLYRYVSAKDDLVLLMQERGIGGPPEPVADAGWREVLEGWTREVAERYQEHPWLHDIAIGGVGVTPNNLAWLDAALEPLEALPIDWRQRIAFVLALHAQGRFEAMARRGAGDGGSGAAGASGEPSAAAESRLLARLVDADATPRVRAALEAGAFAPGDDDPFPFGRDRLLDGLEALVAGIQEGGPQQLTVAEPDPLAAAVDADPKVKAARNARREAEKSLREARSRERQQRREARQRASRR